MAEIEDNKATSKNADSGTSGELSDSGPGDLLTAAREKLNLSIPDVAKQLNLSPSVIEQLESNQYTDQIPDAFIRGYLRTYARAVEIDEEEIVAIYTRNIGLEIVRNYYVPSTDIAPVKSQVGSHMLWFKILSLALIITILVLGWMAFKENTKKPTSPSNILTSPIQKTDKEIDLNSKPVTRAELSNDKADNNSDSASQLVEQEVVTEELAQPESRPVNADLEFSFIEDCWVQVIDSDEEVLAVGLKSAGRRFSVSGVPPIRVVLGKPRAVSLQFNNELVDLTIYPAGQTARFSLGESPSTLNSISRD